MVVTAGADMSVRIFDIKPKEAVLFSGHTGPINCVEFSKDGRYIISGASDYSSKVWDRAGNLIKTFKGTMDYYVTPCMFIDTGKYVSLVANGEGLVVWNRFNSNNIMISVSQGFHHNKKPIVINDRIFITAKNDVFYEFSSMGDIVDTLPNVVSYSRFSDDNILCLMKDSTIQPLKIRVDEERFDMGQVIKAVPFYGKISSSPKGDCFVTTQNYLTIRICKLDIKTNVIDFIEVEVKKPVIGCIVNKNGTLIAVNVEGNSILLFNAQGEKLGECLGHSEEVTHVEFSNDGNYLTSSSLDKSVRIWNIDGSLALKLPIHKSDIFRAKYSPDDKFVASCSGDHTILIMPTTIEQVLDKINIEKVRGEVYQLSLKDKEVFGILEKE